jgi:hypothetical protein
MSMLLFWVVTPCGLRRQYVPLKRRYLPGSSWQSLKAPKFKNAYGWCHILLRKHFNSSVGIFLCLQFSSTQWFSRSVLRHTVWPLGWGISLTRSFSLHSTTEPRQTKHEHPCSKWESNSRSSVRALKARALVRAATGSSYFKFEEAYFDTQSWNFISQNNHQNKPRFRWRLQISQPFLDN